MTPKELLEEIFKTRTVIEESGNMQTLNSNIDEKEGEFLYDIIKKYKVKNTIEVGCAMGISSLFICSALYDEVEKHHTIIDPMQSSDWGNIGKSNLDKANINFYEIIEQPSEIALPFLLSQQKQYDLGFIDGWHTFDHTLLDFFYLNRLIRVGGIIVIDDVTFPGIKRALRYILNYPNYEYIGGVNFIKNKTVKHYLYHKFIPSAFKVLSKCFPVKMRAKLFTSNVLNPDINEKLNCSMVAIRKINEDNRRWDWFKEF